MSCGNTLGATIRRLRKQRRLTQEQLAEGICSPVSVSRIESGRQRPSKALLDALMDRLGMSSYQLFDVNEGSEELRAFDKGANAAWSAIDACNVELGKRLIDELAQRAQGENSVLVRQRILELKALSIVRPGCSKADAEKASRLLEEAISLTKPTLDVDDLAGGLLSVSEARIISHLCVARHYAGLDLDAIGLGHGLIRAIGRQGTPSREMIVVKIGALTNLAIVEEGCGHLEEAARHFGQARSECLEASEFNLMPFVLAGLARARWRAGETREAAAALRTVADYLDLCDRHDYAKAIRSWLGQRGGQP